MQIDKLTWEETVAQRDIDDWIEEQRAHQHTVEQKMKAIVVLTYCVNQLEGITPGERGLLREMLGHSQANTMRLWGAVNLHRMEEVRVLFEKIKCLIA